jgi:hypothetical protein
MINLITHAHPDHTAELESFFMLLREYRENLGSVPPDLAARKRQVRLYLSRDSMGKFAPLLRVWGDCLDDVRVFPPGSTAARAITLLDGCTVTPLSTYHRDDITEGNAIGLRFHLIGEASKDKKTEPWERSIVFTADTGLFPLARISHPRD